MFKLFKISKEGKEIQVYPENGIYVVYELFEYKFEFIGKVSERTVFIEDEVLDFEGKILTYTDRGIYTKVKKRFFEDFFGYLTINIDSNKFNFEARIQKLKIPELEDILLYLWNQDPIIFNNFFSKSTLKSRLTEKDNKLSFSSKFVNVFEDFYAFFKKRYFLFKSLPHYVLRTEDTIKNYEQANINSKSIDWLISNLDELHIGYEYKYAVNSIQLNNTFGIIDKILTEEKINNFDVYENQIILGAFDFVSLEIVRLKKRIREHLSIEQYYEKSFYSINEFRIIPFLKLKDDLNKIESKIKSLKVEYQEIFKKTKSNNSFPKLTPVFSNKRHYTNAYNQIRLIRDVNINIEGELSLINIKKISTLYERFNLYVLINILLKKKPISFKKENPTGENNTFQEFHFQYNGFKVILYYDMYVGNQENETGLVRISDGYYKPDYILKLDNQDESKFYILDSKYSSENTVSSSHLNKCIKKYILDIGIINSSTTKVQELILIYPGEREKIFFGNDIFKPKVSILPSKIGKSNLEDFIKRMLP
jgi:hypothetical protein